LGGARAGRSVLVGG